MHGILPCACPKLHTVPGAWLHVLLLPDLTPTPSERGVTIEITLHAGENLIHAKLFPKRILDINISIMISN